MHTDDKELEILDAIQAGRGPRQRDLARVVGLSLGMTNSIVKRLAQKGLLMVRKINNRNIRYVVTPEGLEEIGARSYRYFKRTIKNIVRYKEGIDLMVRGAVAGGAVRVVLVGKSDLDFIVEHACTTYGIRFERRGGPAGEAGTLEMCARSAGTTAEAEFLIFAETLPASATPSGGAELKRLIAAV